jgi:putative transposase
MKNPQFVSGEIYHIYNRGVEKRDIFLDDQDRLRCIHDLFEFNDLEPADKFLLPPNWQHSEVKLPNVARRPRKLIVKLLAFYLGDNHFHLMLRQTKENGITLFMRKLGTGYTNYFNKKYERVGSLFQGPFKASLVKTEAHFIHLPYYIHLNALDSIAPQWRDGKIKDINKTIKFLDSYRWSSHLDYLGKKNFPSVTQREFLMEFWGGSEKYKESIIKRLEENDLEEIKPIILE